MVLSNTKIGVFIMSPQSCRVCGHKDRQSIESEMMSNVAHTRIGAKYNVSNQSISYHFKHHLSKRLLELNKESDVLHLKSMNEEIEDLVSKTKAILHQAESKKKHRLSLKCLSELRSTFEFMVKISVYLHEQQERTEEKDKLQQKRNLNNLSDKELNLLERLLAKAEGDGEGEEIIDIYTSEDPYEEKLKVKSSRFKKRRVHKVEKESEEEKTDRGQRELVFKKEEIKTIEDKEEEPEVIKKRFRRKRKIGLGMFPGAGSLKNVNVLGAE